jgi:hypothetical protein
MNKNLFLIHGAWCSKHSFNFIVKKVLDDSPVGRIKCFEYDCQKESVESIVNRSRHEVCELSKNGLKTVIVGHSLGGLFALKLSQRPYIQHTITLASPLAGLESLNPFFHFFLMRNAPVLKHLYPSSKFIKGLHKKDYSKKTVECHIATSGYNPLIFEPSDGVVSVRAQTLWTPKGAILKHINTNHSEILQAPETILSIERALKS